MSYPFILNRVQEITVDARIENQQIIERYHFRSSDPTSEGADGASSTFLGNFRTLYRAQILSFHYDNFSVARYWCREIDGAQIYRNAIPAVPPRVTPTPAKWRSTYNTEGIDLLEGGVLDVGAVAVGASKMLPAHEALRARKVPIIHRIGYFKAGFTRFAGFSVGDKDASPEHWAAATLATVQTALDNVWNTNIGAGGVESWKLAIWSPDYFGRVVKTGSGRPSEAAPTLQAWIPLVTVGTQISRRYYPSGLKRGS